MPQQANRRRGIVTDARLVRPETNDRGNYISGALYSGFIGLCLGLLIYNLALWRALRYPFQGAYCLMVGALACYAFSTSGLFGWIFFDLPHTLRFRLNFVFLALAAAAAIAFARAFFGTSVFRGWLDRASRIAMAGILLPAIVIAVAAPWQFGLLYRIFSLSFLALAVLVVPIIWRASRHGSTFLWIFAIAWSAPISVAALRIASSLDLLPNSAMLDRSTLSSLTVEALVSALAIAYRIHLLSRERDTARIREDAIRLLADTDPMTGLLNRRAFLRDAVGRRGDQMLAVVDLDHFKQINDTLGHDGGDEVLRVVAQTLRDALPGTALVARFGGEEFVIVMTVVDMIEPEFLLTRLRAARMPYDLTVTASIGTCRGPLRTEQDWKQLYRFADRALFDAKESGRDRVRNARAA